MLALTCGLTLATKSLPSLSTSPTPSSTVCVEPSTYCLCSLEDSTARCASSVFKTSACDCKDTNTASAEVTHPEQARQSVRDICAGAWLSTASLSSVVTSYAFYQNQLGYEHSMDMDIRLAFEDFEVEGSQQV